MNAPFRPTGPIAFLDCPSSRCKDILDGRGPSGEAIACGEAKAKGSNWCAHHRLRYTRGTAHKEIKRLMRLR